MQDTTSTTRAAAIAAAGAAVAASRARQRARTVADAARAAYTPGGPTIVELEVRIRARRAAAVKAVAA